MFVNEVELDTSDFETQYSYTQCINIMYY